MYFARRVTAGWSQQKTTRVIKVCCTYIHLQIKAQNKFKLKHRYVIVVQAYVKCKKKKNAGNPSIWQNKTNVRFWETIRNKIKAMRIQVMQFTVRQYQTGNYIIHFHNTHNLTVYLF